MYVINPAPASQDIQPTASSYVTVHHSGSRESIELEQQQHKEILSQILTKCNADMSEQVANFSCPDEKTPHRPTTTVAKDGTKPSTSPTSARPSIASPGAAAERHDSLKPASEPSSSSSKAPVGEDDTAARLGKDGEVRSPPPTVKRSTSPDSSPLSTASSSNAASLSPASSDGPTKPQVKLEPSTETLAPASNFSSVVHPKERALKSIAAAAASNERNSVVNGGNATAKPSTKFTGTGRTMLNGTSGFPTGTSANIGSGTASGGRLQFFKDGKFILELARAREGEKTSWISVPRKTYWPPTVSSTSANFHKHESSTSLSFSDDNSSIQSSPWQRDHCWKQSNPRPNISKELSLYYFRPLKARGRPSQDTRLRWRRKRRRPYEPNLPPEATSKVQLNSAVESEVAENGNNECKKKETKPSTDENGEVTPDRHSEMSNGTVPMDTTEVVQENKEDETDVQTPKRTTPKGQMEDKYEQSNGHHLTPNVTNFRASRWKRSGGKELSAIIKTLIEQQQTKVTNAMTSPAGVGSAVGPFRLGTIAERGSNSGSSFRSSVFSSSAASQHVSPRKRILRELEKVSLDDVGSGGTSSTKRSRPKSGSAVGTSVIVTATTATPLTTLTTNGTGSSLNGSSSSGSSSNTSSKTNGHLNGSGSIVNGTTGVPGKHSLNGAGSSLSPASKNASAAPVPVSKPFSSYSITSLLGHSTSSSSGESSSSANSSASDALQRKTDVSVASVTSTASHHLYHHSQHPLSPHQQYQGLTIGSKSPIMMDAAHHAHYQGQLGSNRYGYSTKKRSPSYVGGNGTAASPEATSGGSGSVDPYGNTIRSPDLSPSPEHHHTHQQHSHHSANQPPHGLHHTPGSVSNSGFSRYRQHPYGGSPSSYSSAPSSSRFSPSPSTNDSATTPPYSGSVSGARSAISYRAGYQLSGNGSQGHSPPASNGSPQHYSRASPLNFGRGAHHSPPPPAGSHHHQHNRTTGTSSSSPRASPNGGGVTTSHNATTPTSAMASLTTGTAIRTVPKKTAALRQPFSGGHSPSSSSPSRERSNSNASSSSVKKESQPEGSDLVDGPSLSHHYGTTPSSPAGIIRPNTVIASPTAHHPVASPYYPLYQTPLSASSSSPSMNATAVAVAAAAAVSAVPFHAASLSYYQQMYTAATMGFRTPFWMHYQGLPGVAPHAPHLVQSPHHHLPSPSSAAPTMQLADRRIIERNPPSPPPPPTAPASSSITEPSESQRLQHSILATPSTTAAALNYSVTALSSSSRGDIINGGSAFSSPSGPNWPTDALAYHHHPELSSRSSVAASGITSATAKDDPSNDVPLNLSKH